MKPITEYPSKEGPISDLIEDGQSDNDDKLSNTSDSIRDRASDILANYNTRLAKVGYS